METETEGMRQVIQHAKRGDVACQLQLAETYLLGKVCKMDLQKAAYWGLRASTHILPNASLPDVK